jgi:hypothetical protein
VIYEVTQGPVGKLLYQTLYVGRAININLEIVDYPEWSEAYIVYGTITTKLPREDTTYTHQKTIMISVDENAPAFRNGVIRVKVTVPDEGMVEGFEQILELPFKPDYLGMLKVSPNTQHKKIGPMDTAEIPISVTNLGNGKTKVEFSIKNVPDNWLAIVTDHIILEPGQSGTVFLTVKPPKGFGYHDDYEGFVIEYTPAWAEDINITGETEHVSLAVESRGISVIGIEVILPIIILIVLVIVAIYYFIKKMQKK